MGNKILSIFLLDEGRHHLPFDLVHIFKQLRNVLVLVDVLLLILHEDVDICL